MIRALVILALAAASPKRIAKAPDLAAVATDPAGNVYVSAPGQILKLTRGRLEPFRATTNNAAGITFDRQGRLIICETSDSARRHPRVVRIDLSTGESQTLAEAFAGKPLNGPVAVTVDSKHRVYFTDPARDATQESGVFRIDDLGRGARILSSVANPRAIAVSPGDRKLYVADTGAILAFGLDEDGNAGASAIHQKGPASALCIDPRGNLHISAANGCATSGRDLYITTPAGLFRQ